MRRTSDSRVYRFFRRLYSWLPQPPSTNYSLGFPRIKPYNLLTPGSTILDIGSKDRQGSYRTLGQLPFGAKVLSLDISAGANVDIVADAHNLHRVIADSSIDCVIAISLLEHTARPWQVVEEIFRILKPGGVVYINTPWVYPYHDDPEDYYRFSHRGLELLCGRFQMIESGYNRGPASTLAQTCAHGFALCLSFNTKFLYGVFTDILKWLLAPLKYLDYFYKEHPMRHVVASGAFFLGKRPGDSVGGA